MSNRPVGFTLVELMITIAVLAVLLAIGFPSFQNSLRSNRVATTVNEMIASLSLARSDAIRNGHGAGVCASSAGTACDGGTWGAGWMVWADTNGNGTFEAGETVIKFTAANPRMVGDAANRIVAYDARGRLRAANPLSITLRPDECGSQQLQRTLNVSRTGQVKVAPGACP